jgi:hypothetical protein
MHVDRNDETATERVVMQPRCVFCDREQYALVVSLVSRAQAGCSWCGSVPPVFRTEQEYRDAKVRMFDPALHAATFGCTP